MEERKIVWNINVLICNLDYSCKPHFYFQFFFLRALSFLRLVLFGVHGICVCLVCFVYVYQNEILNIKFEMKKKMYFATLGFCFSISFASFHPLFCFSHSLCRSYSGVIVITIQTREREGGTEIRTERERKP